MRVPPYAHDVGAMTRIPSLSSVTNSGSSDRKTSPIPHAVSSDQDTPSPSTSSSRGTSTSKVSPGARGSVGRPVIICHSLVVQSTPTEIVYTVFVVGAIELGGKTAMIAESVGVYTIVNSRGPAHVANVGLMVRVGRAVISKHSGVEVSTLTPASEHTSDRLLRVFGFHAVNVIGTVTVNSSIAAMEEGIPVMIYHDLVLQSTTWISISVEVEMGKYVLPEGPCVMVTLRKPSSMTATGNIVTVASAPFNPCTIDINELEIELLPDVTAFVTDAYVQATAQFTPFISSRRTVST